jgi:hypothetical protein
MEPTFSEGPRKSGRRQTDTDGIPWQIRAIVLMGVPSAIACYLVWVLASNISPSLSAQGQTLNQLVLSVSNMRDEHSQMRAVNEAMLRVLQASCVNNAKDSIERERCLR